MADAMKGAEAAKPLKGMKPLGQSNDNETM